jgi:uncharacterized membrane protein (DUF2068 family)
MIVRNSELQTGTRGQGEAVERHIRILGMIYTALGALGILAALLLFVGVTGEGLLSENRETILITTSAATAVAVLLVLISIFAIIGGAGLLRRRSWARVLVIVLGCLYLFSFPLGTGVGIYTLWALTKPEARAALSPG